MSKQTDREKLSELLKEFFDGEEDGGFVLYFTDSECEIIADYLLSHGVTFEKQGEWVAAEKCNHKPCRIKNPEKWKIRKCSECGYSNGIRQSNYCPNCGARMKGAVNNE